MVVGKHFQQRVEIGRRRISVGLEAVALVDLVHRQPGLDIFLRLVVEDVLAAVGAEVVLAPLVVALAVADLGRVIRLREEHRYLARLAQHGQRVVVPALALFLQCLPMRETRPVELVESVGIFLR